MVRPIVNRFKDGASVAKAAAADLFSYVSGLLDSQARVDIAVTGGTVGIATLAEASHLDFNSLDLSRLHIWWGDERFVTSANPDRNALQAANAWLSKLNIPTANIHEFPAADHLELHEAATSFNKRFKDSQVTFDLMLMGIGPDGHIASLFPGKPTLSSEALVVAEDDSPKPPSLRLSFTLNVINSSKQIWFTVAGADKADAVAVAFGDEPGSLPVGRVHGKEKTVWYVDQTAGNLVWGC